MSGPLTAFIEESYQDTLSLMTELRDYLAEVNDSTEAGPPSPDDTTTKIIREISGMTRYLTEAMAWLLLQKAVAAGEISGQEARDRSDGLMSANGGEPVPDGAAGLPIEVRGYIDRTRRIYNQITRLRDIADRGTDSQ